jgi:hypothetical protein
MTRARFAVYKHVGNKMFPLWFSSQAQANRAYERLAASVSCSFVQLLERERSILGNEHWQVLKVSERKG